MKGFCEKCRDTVEYDVKMVDKDKTIKGKVISYVGKVARCGECNSEIFAAEIRDYNLKALDIAYRKVENLINSEDIERI